MKTSVFGYPRIGRRRELKKATESYFRGDITAAALESAARAIRLDSWLAQNRAGVAHIPSNDFSLYDAMLDTALLFGLVPSAYRETGLSGLELLFAMARGHQDSSRGVDIKALPMRKWFNTNYHYIVPTIEDYMAPKLVGAKPVDEFREALAEGILTRPTLIGPFTFLRLAHFSGEKNAPDFVDSISSAYGELIGALRTAGAERVQLEEPSLATDLRREDIDLFKRAYGTLLESKGSLALHLAVPFGDVRDCYDDIVSLPFDGIALDFVEGSRNLDLIEARGFPPDKTLVAGIVNGKNVWKCDAANAIDLLRRVAAASGRDAADGTLEIGTSCSLLFVPVSLSGETVLDESLRSRLSFAEEKLLELRDLADIFAGGLDAPPDWRKDSPRDESVRERVANLSAADFSRAPERAARFAVQQERFGLPALPTTTIGSFPQTAEVRALRAAYRKGAIGRPEYDAAIKNLIAECVARQEKIGLDVLVHGEFERNDMVEFFGQNLEGFAFTSNGWVQSYGTRCVKPPILVSDVSRARPLTVGVATFAQSLSEKPVKGMLTGPVTILNWSFPRDDISLGESAYQIALAVRDEVLDLERNGISVIQIDEAALREKMPLRAADKRGYFAWAIPAFRLTHSGVRAETQIHTHMCYSDFTDIVDEIDAMDADVITFEASRSNLELIDFLAGARFKTAVGAGVYDIHSPRVPSQGEIECAITATLSKLGKSADRYDGVWVNPDCGLKTRGNDEVWSSLENLVRAAKRIRDAHCGRA